MVSSLKVKCFIIGLLQTPSQAGLQEVPPHQILSLKKHWLASRSGGTVFTVTVSNEKQVSDELRLPSGVKKEPIFCLESLSNLNWSCSKTSSLPCDWSACNSAVLLHTLPILLTLPTRPTLLTLPTLLHSLHFLHSLHGLHFLHIWRIGHRHHTHLSSQGRGWDWPPWPRWEDKCTSISAWADGACVSS